VTYDMAVTIRRRPSDPWFDGECRQSKREVRRLERSSRRLKTPEARAAWYSKRNDYRAPLRRKRECFWQAKIEAEKSKPCELSRSIDALLGRGKTLLPDINAAQFHRFFDDKVHPTPSLQLFHRILPLRCSVSSSR